MVEHPGNVSTRFEDVRGSGIHPATGPYPPGHAVVRSPAALAHPEERRVPKLTDEDIERAARFAGRSIFGGYFLYNGINHFVNRKMLADYARAKGVPAADAAVVASGTLILAGGFSVLTGTRPKIGAAMIAAFLLAVSPLMHAFWKEQDVQQRTNELVNFTKNMALVGASLLAAGPTARSPWQPFPSRSGALVPSRQA